MEETLLKLKSIEELVKSGVEDKVVERTVDKLYSYQSKNWVKISMILRAASGCSKKNTK